MGCMTSSSSLSMSKNPNMRAERATVLICTLALALSGCVATAPVLEPSVTLAPVTAAPTATPEPTLTPEATSAASTPQPTLMLTDALGNSVSDETHFRQYITFKGIQVYEHSNDTFVDLIAENSYPEPLVCALEIVFYEGSGDSREEVARGKLQTRDAQYMLTLAPGENTLYAQVNSDMTLTSLEFELIYDEAVMTAPA